MALALLLGLALLLNFPDLAPLRTARLALFDQYQKLVPRTPQAQPVVIVEIDEAALGAIGQWPWPRHYLAALIDAIAALKPAAVGLDIIMPESDHASPQALAEARPDLPASVRQTLAASASNDAMLAASLAHAPTVLGAAGFPFRTYATREGLRSREIRTLGNDPLPWLSAYPFVLASLPEFQAAAQGQALLSSNPELGVVRRATLLSALNGAVVPGLSLELLRVAQGAPAMSVVTGKHGIEAVEIAGPQDMHGAQRIPLESNGEAWVHFDAPAAAASPRQISALSLLKGEVAAERIAGKIVLIGLTGLGLQDMITTPHGDRRAGVEVHAQLIESIADGHFLTRPWWMPWAELAALLICGGLLIWAVPRLQPRIATLLTVILWCVLFGAGLALFRSAGWLFDAANLFAAINIVFGSLLSSMFIEADRQRLAAEQALQQQREAAARVAGELEAARRIQLSSLPQAATLFAHETRFEIAALLEPARQVGGDLYDFYLLDEKRLFFVIADVSGKGLPASLFMAVTKALTKSAALRGNAGLDQVIATATLEMGRENSEMLFVTAIAGILDADSGRLEFVNAGHDAPWRITPDGGCEQLKSSGGPPLCVLDDFIYPVEQRQLAPGETLCLVTDGITEAMNAAGELYGTARLAACLAAQGQHAAPQALVSALRADVRAFVGNAEASDDLTLLALRWNGRG